MGGKSRASPPPDYTPVANASAEAAKYSYDLGKEQLAWAKEQYAQDKSITNRVIDAFLTTQNKNDRAAAMDRSRYEQIFQPLEDSLAKDAQDYASPERKDLERGRAISNVAQQFDAQRANAVRDLEAYGINPGSTRFAALDFTTRAQQAATAASAANQSDQMVDATGRALRSEAINVGRGYPGQVAGTYNTALQAGTGAVNNSLATTASGANTMGTGVQWQGQGNNALNSWTNALNGQAQANYYADKLNQSSSSGLGSVLGFGASALMQSSKPWIFAADGGEIEPAGDVPMEASPSGGRAVDDVKTALTAGEFVMPKEAVNWYGQKHFYGLIEKAGREKDEMKQRTGAIPQVHPATAHAMKRSPTRAALPVR